MKICLNIDCRQHVLVASRLRSAGKVIRHEMHHSELDLGAEHAASTGVGEGGCPHFV